MNITHFKSDSELLDVLLNFSGCSFGTMQTSSEVEHNKKSRVTGEHWTLPKVYCTKIEYIMVGSDYQNMVNNQRIRENHSEHFISESLPWGEWVKPNLIIKHKDKFYLRYYKDVNVNSKHNDYFYHYANGRRLTTSEIKKLNEYLPKNNNASSRQETEKKIKPRNCKISGILSLSLNKTIYARN
jgi:hypothetical protein